ncbi:MAG TPA: universal stress protein [Streptosporangiaceae bacterium]|jgi:nucleotide-binding universal stress UspA family protein
MRNVVTSERAPARLPEEPPPATGKGDERSRLAGTPRRIVVGIDDSPGGLNALRWAVSQARIGGVQLVAVRSWALGLPRHGGRRRRRPVRVHPHLVLTFDGGEQCQGAAERVRESFQIAAGGPPLDVAVTVQTPEGDPGATLTDIATDDGDLLVVGQNRGLSVRRLLHGSVSRYCTGHSRCPVVIVPAAQDEEDCGSQASVPVGRTILGRARLNSGREDAL